MKNVAAGLASSLRLAGTGTQGPLWGRLPELTVPESAAGRAAGAGAASATYDPATASAKVRNPVGPGRRNIIA